MISPFRTMNSPYRNFTPRRTTSPREDVECDLIEVVNLLQEKLAASGHTLDVSLPQIVVVGCQSAGKSSVLENVVGREFLPRGSGVVTRRPTVVQLEPCKDEYAQFLHRDEERFTDFRDVMNEIRNETLRDPGPVGFSSKPIFLKIYSPKVLKLTLVDLPGLIKVAIGDQSEDAIQEVRNMVLQYIRQPNSLILAVSPANQDIANSDALEIAKSVDPERVRTIGVLTKLDLMDDGTDARDILENKKIPLTRGYVGVLNRSQKDIDEGRDIPYCIDKEKHFFASMPCYKHMNERMGSVYLQKMLHLQLRKHIKESLPAVRQELSQKLACFHKELKDLQIRIGVYPNVANGVQSVLIKLLQEFTEKFLTQIFGLSPDVDMKELSAGAVINHKLYKDIQNGLNMPSLPKQEELLRIIINVHGIRNCWSMPSLALDAVGCQLLSQYMDPLNDCVDNIAEIFNTCAEKTCQTMDQYPNLRIEVLYWIRKYVEDSAFNTKQSLAQHIEAEKCFMNTYHQDFDFPEFKATDIFQPIKLWDGKLCIKETEDDNDDDDAHSSNNGDTDTFEESKAIMNSLLSNPHACKYASLLSEMIQKYLIIQQKQIYDTAIKYISFFLVKGVSDYVKTGLMSTVLGSPNLESLLKDCERDFVRMQEIEKTCEYLDEALNAVQNFQ